MSSGVVRVGDIDRRPAGPWTPAVHALLAHLHAVGFHSAPRPLGVDERGCDVLTFVPGMVAWPGGFRQLNGGGQLRRAAGLIRDFHDAVAGFTPPPGAQWQALMPADGDEIIAHHDLAPWNLIIADRGWAFIDWDAAAPGPGARSSARGSRTPCPASTTAPGRRTGRCTCPSRTGPR